MTEGRYKFVRKIGEGGLCEVFEYFDREKEISVAIKALWSHLCKDERSLLFIEHEKKVLKEVNHPGIIKIYDSIPDFPPHLVLECFNHPNLTEHIGDEDKIDLSKACEISSKISSTNSYLGEKGIVHLDIKPDNILFSLEDNEIRICDFALAQYFFEPEKNMKKPKRVIYGTPQFMPPEVSFGDINVKSDIFSQGVLLYFLLKKEIIEEKETALETFISNIAGLPLRLKGNFPNNITKLIENMTQFESTNRPNQSEIIKELGNYF